ncbi:MAG: hypothetical protein ACLFVG_10880 [Candidatus Aminicenantes bacterium]
MNCYTCHKTKKEDNLFMAAHLENNPNPIAVVVQVLGGSSICCSLGNLSHHRGPRINFAVPQK